MLPALAGSFIMQAAVNPVSKWNEVTVQATYTAGEGGLPQFRSLAIVQVAIHDALKLYRRPL